jgi:hypothetical protein
LGQTGIAGATSNVGQLPSMAIGAALIADLAADVERGALPKGGPAASIAGVASPLG